MIRYRCDCCGLDLQPDGGNHYIVKIEAFAAAGRLEITEVDLKRDHDAEIRRAIDDLSKRHPDDIEDAVYRAFRFDLCPACHRRFLANPMAISRGDRRDG